MINDDEQESRPYDDKLDNESLKMMLIRTT